MKYLIIGIVILLILIITKIIFGISSKQIKEIAENKKLDEITKKYPNNIEMCKWYLKKLNNESVKIEENLDTKNCIYIAVNNKILIANIKNSYTRIQTIAHECLHSVQDRKLLLFNFIFSNIYLIYFFVIVVLSILRILPNKMVALSILILLSMTYFLIRAYLENDAMIKAKYLAKEYMEDIKASEQKEINEILEQYEKINKVGIKATNYYLFFNVCVKIIIFCIICFII